MSNFYDGDAASEDARKAYAEESAQEALNHIDCLPKAMLGRMQFMAWAELSDREAREQVSL